MNKVLAVARREFIATVRTKAFLLTVVLMPGIIVASIYGGQAVERAAREETKALRRMAVWDQAGDVYEQLRLQVGLHNRERPNQPFELEAVSVGDRVDLEAELAGRVRAGELYGYIVITPQAVTGESGAVLARQDNQLEIGKRIESWIREAVIAARLLRVNIDPQQIAAVRLQPVPVLARDVTTGTTLGEEKQVARFLTPFAFMFLMFMGTFGIAQGLLTTLIEEKGSRIVEVLLSAVSPTQLLAGKIIGMVSVGFVLLAAWGGVAFLAAQKYHLGEAITGYRLLLAALYFVPGFLLTASLMAAIGSACNELRDAQSMVFPLTLITVVPLIFWLYLAEHPDAPLSVALSYVPPIIPFVMILRVCADPATPTWQIVSTLAWLWLCVWMGMWAAGKVFRVGVLMYGKPPSPLELLRWVRYS